MLGIWFLLIGAILVLMAFASHMVERLPISAAIIYLAIGWAVGPSGAGLLPIVPAEDAHLIALLAEIAVLISLFAVGLKLRVPFTFVAWRVPLRLASWGMLASIAVAALAARIVLDLPWPAALLLGAVLAPTDPVLASDVQVRAPGERDAVRFSLTAEGGINDGMAFPAVMLALGLLGAHPLGVYGTRWLLVDLLWATAGGVAVGLVCGTLVRYVIERLRRAGRALEFEEFLVLGVIGLAYGGALFAGTYGFLAVFAAGLALSQLDAPAAPARPMASRLLTFTGQAERLWEVAVVLLTGALIAYIDWSVALLLFVGVMLVVVRPLAVLAAVPRRILRAPQRRLVAWFGIRGVGSIYYLAFAVTHGIDAELGQALFGITVATVAVSILVHGISATPLMSVYERRRGSRAGAAHHVPNSGPRGTPLATLHRILRRFL